MRVLLSRSMCRLCLVAIADGQMPAPLPGTSPAQAANAPGRSARTIDLELDQAGYGLQQVNSFAGRLGMAIGVKPCRPYDSSGEDHLASFLGMIGIPTRTGGDRAAAGGERARRSGMRHAGIYCGIGLLGA